MFKKAKTLNVKVTLEGSKRIFATVGKQDVALEYFEETLKTHCSCDYMLRSKPSNLCSHKLALIKYLIDNENKP